MNDDQGNRPVNVTDITRDDRNLAVMAHLLALFGFMIPGLNIVIPLVIWLARRDRSSYVEHHARESLNFQITLSLLMALWIALKLMLVGLFLLPLVPVAVIVVLVFMVRAAMKAGSGELYRYPVSLRLVN